jgi:acyl-CoA hydrolase
VISDPCLDLLEAGVMTGARKEIDPGEAVATAAIGTARLHAALAGAAIALRPSSHVHAPGPLGQLQTFVSLNSALEVDLLGQVNTTSIAGRLVSGMGGFTDFARPARQSPKGRAIVMLPATAGPHSRIVAQFAAGTPVTASALDIDMVVTEHGVARLAGHDWDARATALIAIAAPAHRDALAAAWREIRARL